MPEEVTYMDIPEVKKISQIFGNVSDVLKGVSAALQAAITILKTTAFVGLVGGLAVAHFMENLKPQVDKLADQCAELSTDVAAAVKAFEDGEEEGSRKFY